jgi:hypothetical protein
MPDDLFAAHCRIPSRSGEEAEAGGHLSGSARASRVEGEDCSISFLLVPSRGGVEGPGHRAPMRERLPRFAGLGGTCRRVRGTPRGFRAISGERSGGFVDAASCRRTDRYDPGRIR